MLPKFEDNKKDRDLFNRDKIDDDTDLMKMRPS
jgi:hypothetical protein